MDTTKPIKTQPATCLHCGTAVPQVAGAGRLKRYCAPEHGRAWRRKARFFGWL